MPDKKAIQALRRTRQTWFRRLGAVLQQPSLNEGLWQELEEILIGADVGVETTFGLLKRLRERLGRWQTHRLQDATEGLRQELVGMLEVEGAGERGGLWADSQRSGPFPKPAVILVVGVNGAGKTTSVAKLANIYKSDGRKVILAAADTFRAAAIDQLKEWGQRLGAEVVAHKEGASPAAVVFDSLAAADKRGADVVIIDTAGRLHTKDNLMEEMRKIHSVIQRRDSSSPHEVLLVLDSTSGQNALAQASYFSEAISVTGIFLCKLDGTARGGIVFTICDRLRIPIRFLGTGEQVEDISFFEARTFVDALLR